MVETVSRIRAAPLWISMPPPNSSVPNADANSSTKAPARQPRRIRTRKALKRSALWAEIADEVQRVLEGVERGRPLSHHAAVVVDVAVQNTERSATDE